MNLIRAFKIILLSGLMLLVTVLAARHYMHMYLAEPLRLDSPTLLKVEKGQYAHALLEQLHQSGVLTRVLPIKLYLKLNPHLAQIKTGTYEMIPDMTAPDLFDTLSQGQEKQFSISLVEGLRWRDWQLQLKDTAHLQPLDTSDSSWLASLQPKLEAQSLEGWLMPDTYHFTAGTPALAILQRAYSAMHEYLHTVWAKRALDLPYQSPYEALIMASIIEKETGLAEERSRIAGVFVNRLRQNMRLQTDPTVIYGMGEAFDGNIRRKDLRTPTPYNTYVIKGLPPTPIAMPGREAIDAALHPMQTDELYFVAKGDGSHQFSRTLDEHNQAVRTFQLK